MALWSLPLIYAVPFGKMRHGGGTLSDGLSWGFGNRDTDPASVPAWVGRAERAGRNHFENLPMFAILVLVLHVSGKHDDVTGFEVAEFTVPSSPNAKRPRFLPIWLARKGKAAD